MNKEKQRVENDEMWQEFDEDKNEVHYCSKVDDTEKWYRYDKNGNMIHFKNDLGDEIWSKYDENRNEIYFKNNYNEGIWRTFDEKNNLIHYRDSGDNEYWYRYEVASGKQIKITEKEFKEKYSNYLEERNNFDKIIEENKKLKKS